MEKQPNHDFDDMSPEDIQKYQDELEKQLAAEGMPSELGSTQQDLAKAGFRAVGFEQEFEAVRDMQNLTDDEVEQENVWGDPVDPKDGLAPCIRLKISRENQYGAQPLENIDEEEDL